MLYLNSQSSIEWQEIAAMRLLLRQPSCAWSSFGIENLTVYRELPKLPPYCVPIQDPQKKVNIFLNYPVIYSKRKLLSVLWFRGLGH